jgi:hypothetical protein
LRWTTRNCDFTVEPCWSLLVRYWGRHEELPWQCVSPNVPYTSMTVAFGAADHPRAGSVPVVSNATTVGKPN